MFGVEKGKVAKLEFCLLFAASPAVTTSKSNIDGFVLDGINIDDNKNDLQIGWKMLE